MKLLRQPMTTRGRALALPAALALGAVALPRAARVRAQDDERGQLAEVPSTGGARSGPMVGVVGAEAEPVAESPPGVTPLVMQIPDAGVVDAPVEVGTISPEGVMLDPSGPWVVTWYKDLAMVGQEDNVVMAGHVDYWEVGPAIFQGVPNLQPGSLITLATDDGQTFQYAVAWSRLYDVKTELTPEVIQTEVVGPTGQESLTLITCGGAFDGVEYLQRWVIRANLVSQTTATGEVIPVA